PPTGDGQPQVTVQPKSIQREWKSGKSRGIPKTEPSQIERRYTELPSPPPLTKKESTVQIKMSDSFDKLSLESAKVLGKGSYGTVYESKDKDGRAIAIKKIVVNKHNAKRIKDEVVASLKLKSAHILSATAHWESNDQGQLEGTIISEKL